MQPPAPAHPELVTPSRSRPARPPRPRAPEPATTATAGQPRRNPVSGLVQRTRRREELLEGRGRRPGMCVRVCAPARILWVDSAAWRRCVIRRVGRHIGTARHLREVETLQAKVHVRVLRIFVPHVRRVVQFWVDGRPAVKIFQVWLVWLGNTRPARIVILRQWARTPRGRTLCADLI